MSNRKDATSLEESIVQLRRELQSSKEETFGKRLVAIETKFGEWGLAMNSLVWVMKHKWWTAILTLFVLPAICALLVITYLHTNPDLVQKGVIQWTEGDAGKATISSVLTKELADDKSKAHGTLNQQISSLVPNLVTKEFGLLNSKSKEIDEKLKTLDGKSELLTKNLDAVNKKYETVKEINPKHAIEVLAAISKEQEAKATFERIQSLAASLEKTTRFRRRGSDGNIYEYQGVSSGEMTEKQDDVATHQDWTPAVILYSMTLKVGKNHPFNKIEDALAYIQAAELFEKVTILVHNDFLMTKPLRITRRFNSLLNIQGQNRDVTLT